MPTPIDHNNIADYFIALSNETQELITNLKLQKLVYYVQAWHLAAFDKPAFPADFEAWVHGPVIPALYQKYRHLGYNPIAEDKDDPTQIAEAFSSELNEILADVVEEYFGRGAYELEKLTHSEDPWITARAGIANNESSNNVIEKDSMIRYYKPLLVS